MKYKYLSPKVWDKLPFVDFRPRFFIETYLEKLSMYTPHFFQSRLMNVISAAHEVEYLINHYRDNEKNIAILRSSIEELTSAFNLDQVANHVFLIYKNHLDEIQSELRGESISQKILQKLSLICRAITSREVLYENHLLDSLRSAIIDPVDIKEKNRIASNIYSLTGLYATQLLNRGYSPTFLFNRAEYFTRLSNYAGKNFPDQFNDVTEKLKKRMVKYNVYFGINVSNPQEILDLKDDPDFAFSDGLPITIKHADVESFKGGEKFNVVAYSSVEASDYKRSTRSFSV